MTASPPAKGCAESVVTVLALMMMFGHALKCGALLAADRSRPKTGGDYGQGRPAQRLLADVSLRGQLPAQRPVTAL
jgi:hypothetical protein